MISLHTIIQMFFREKEIEFIITFILMDYEYVLFHIFLDIIMMIINISMMKFVLK